MTVCYTLYASRDSHILNRQQRARNIMRRFIGSTVAIMCLGVICEYNWASLEPITEDRVIGGWLQSEALDPTHQYRSHYQRLIAEAGSVSLDNPDFNNPEENEVRRRIFDKVRGDYDLWRPIHRSTRWYRTTIWLGNPLRRIVGPFLPEPEGVRPICRQPLILWGHDVNGLLIVLEGNHRWHARSRWSWPRREEVYIGLSPQKYYLHEQSGCRRCEGKEGDTPDITQ